MQITVSNPKYSNDFKEAVARGKRKNCTTEIDDAKEQTIVYVRNANRVVGKLYFEKDDNKAILLKRYIIEKDYRPLEFGLSAVVKFYKKKKIKYVLTESAIIKTKEDFS